MADKTHTVRVHVVVPADMWEQFHGVARKHFRSRSDHLRFLMAEAIKGSDDPLAPITRLIRGEDDS